MMSRKSAFRDYLFIFNNLHRKFFSRETLACDQCINNMYQAINMYYTARVRVCTERLCNDMQAVVNSCRIYRG